MAQRLSVGDEAPNFDLTSTEDVLLMLRDEVVRTPVLVYFFGDTEADSVRSDLLTFARNWDAITELGARVLAVSSSKIPQLKTLQKNLQLPFPLLWDDRGLSKAYGVDADESGTVPSALAVVDRRQQLIWFENPVESVDGRFPEVVAALQTLPSAASTLPRSVVNRWIDRWVN